MRRKNETTRRCSWHRGLDLEEFRIGSECARRWLIYRLGFGEGPFFPEFWRLWRHALNRRCVDSWSRGFFFKLDCCEPDAREWQRGRQPLPSRVQYGTRGVHTNFLSFVVKPLEIQPDTHTVLVDGKRIPAFASVASSTAPASAPICANGNP